MARLAGFADDFGPSRWWHLGHVVARGPFVWVVWHHRRRAGASAIAADSFVPNRTDVRGWFFQRAPNFRTDAPREDHRVALPRVHRRVRGLSPRSRPSFTATRRRDERRERVRGDGSPSWTRIALDVPRDDVQGPRSSNSSRASPRRSRRPPRRSWRRRPRMSILPRRAIARGRFAPRFGIARRGADLWNDSKARWR